jgi:opacity protein-like surface antigen
MNNINKLLLTSALVACSFSVANAQISNKNFVGPSIEVGIQSSNLIIHDLEEEFSNEVPSDTKALGKVSFNYGLPITNRTVIDLGASYVAGKLTAGLGYDAPKLDKMYSLYVAPNLLLTDNTAIFAKISYNRANGTTAVYDGLDNRDSSKTISGLGIGAGVTTYLTKDIYLKAEIERVNYGSDRYTVKDYEDATITHDENYSAKSNNASISIGVKF